MKLTEDLISRIEKELSENEVILRNQGFTRKELRFLCRRGVVKQQIARDNKTGKIVCIYTKPLTILPQRFEIRESL